MATLFEYNEKIDEIMAKATDEEGVIDYSLIEQELNAVNMERKEKIDNIISYVKSRKAMAEALKAEKMAIAKRQKTADNEAENLKKYLGIALKGEEWESTAGKVSYRKSEVVHIDDLDKIPDEYLTYKPEANKTAIKEAIKKDGEIIAGAWIEEKVNTQIK